MIDWLTPLRTDLDAELGRAPKVATLATVRGTHAEARSVVVRHIADDGSLAFTSDARSDKNAELRANPSATLLFWLPKTRRQYRLAGTVAILAPADPRRAPQWQRMTDGARALFLWPPPGQPRDDTAPFPPAVPATEPVPPTFDVLVLTPMRVETLDLNPTPHLRCRWTPGDAGWTAATLNP
jgi:PPOX class probable FMN-dependent enzyme